MSNNLPVEHNDAGLVTTEGVAKMLNNVLQTFDCNPSLRNTLNLKPNVHSVVSVVGRREGMERGKAHCNGHSSF